MAINFPSNPTTGQVYEYQSIRWRWNGSAWDKYEVFTFNGLTANVEGVGSYNGHTGAVQGVSSWNGQTGTVNFYNYVSSYNGHTGAVQGVSSFGGRTGTVGAGITTGQILYWMNNDVAGSNNFTFDGTDIVTLAETGHYSGRLLGPVLVPIKNTGLTLINMGDPVYAVGSVGNSGVVEVFGADAAVSSKMPAIGLADSSLAHNATGHAVVFGNLKLVDTSAYTINGTVFVAPGGGLTGIKPTGANDLIQNIGRVIRVNQSTGDILVSAIGRSNDVPNILQARSWLQMPDGMTATGLVKSFNGLTGAVIGVTQINAGTGIAITGTTNPTVTNTGVLSVNGSTGAITNVALTNTTNTFTALQTFNSGITSAGATFTNNVSVPNHIIKSSGTNSYYYGPYTGLSTYGTLGINCDQNGNGGGQSITYIGDVVGDNNNTSVVVDDSNGIITIIAGNIIDTYGAIVNHSSVTSPSVTSPVFADTYSNIRTYQTTTTATTANQTIATMESVYDPLYIPAGIVPAFEVTIAARDTTLNKTEMLKMHIVQDGTNTVNTQYGLIRTGVTGPVSSYSTTLTGSFSKDLLIRATPSSANSTIFTVTVRGLY